MGKWQEENWKKLTEGFELENGNIEIISISSSNWIIEYFSNMYTIDSHALITSLRFKYVLRADLL